MTERFQKQQCLCFVTNAMRTLPLYQLNVGPNVGLNMADPTSLPGSQFPRFIITLANT